MAMRGNAAIWLLMAGDATRVTAAAGVLAIAAAAGNTERPKNNKVKNRMRELSKGRMKYLAALSDCRFP